MVARGGSGGRGNRHFATATRQTPALRREAACRARSARSSCSCKLLADAGLVGLPNAGQVLAARRLTRAQPKVADYPFTTLEPVLGTLERDDRQLVMADIPGLIEGASAGAGLGHEFLAHVERCRLLVHVLDLSPLDGSDPAQNHATVEAELREHGHGLAELPRLLALSKADLVPPDEVAGGRRATGASGVGDRGVRHLGRDRRRGCGSCADAIFRARAAGGARRRPRRGHAGRPPRVPAGPRRVLQRRAHRARARSAWRASGSSG